MSGRGTVGARRRLVALATLLCVSLTALLAGSSAAGAPIPSGAPGVNIIAQNGFGDRNNSYAWSMGWFQGKLYVGTGRDELCVENEIVQFYFPNSRQYTTDPSPNVVCPQNPFAMPLQAEIWQYTPSRASWKIVYHSPLIKNPGAKGRWIARDEAYRGMIVWRNPQGRQALFAAGVTPDEYLPSLLTHHPPVIMRSYDGVHWQTLHLPSVVVHFPNGNIRPMGFRSLTVWRGHLFVTATPDITGDGGLFEVTNPWSNHPGLRQVSGPQYDIFEIQTFGGGLYIGTGNKQVGYGVYRTFKYNPSGLFNFHQVVANGAGRATVTSVVSMHVYRNQLYVGSSGWYNKGTIPISELIRINRRGSWQLVVGDPRNVGDRTLYPLSGLYDGFFSPFQAHFWRMVTEGNGLYLGTNDWAYTLQQDKSYAWLQETVLAGVLGFNIWATCDGGDWFAVTRDAFDDNEYNFGARNLVVGGPHGQDLYIGSANQAQGASIFDDRDNACSSLVGNSHESLARPASLMSENLRRGTFLSWQRSADASTYTIERAPMYSVELGLKAPATLPDGWTFDDAAPSVTDVGAPGSLAVTLQLPGGFTPVGTTATPSYVDPTPGRYVYEVVANSMLGATSTPSNVVAAPSAGAPATFEELQAALAPAGAKTAAVTDAESATGRLLLGAETASRQGHYALAAHDLALLRASASANENLGAAIARVQRRLQYASIAGAP